MKKALQTAAVIAFAGIAPQHAHAQFWKKIFGEEKKKPVRGAVKSVPKSGPARQLSKAREYVYPPTRKQDRYRIDVFAQLYLNESTPGGEPGLKIPDKAVPGIAFYAGLKLAADTLADTYACDIYIHDATSQEQSPSTVLAKKQIEGTDLIIGALPASQLSSLAAFAAKYSVNFVSVLSPSDGGVRENPFFIQLQPTLKTHCDAIADAAVEAAGKKKVFHFYRTTVTGDASAHKLISEHVSPGKLNDVLINEIPPTAQLRNLLDTTGRNYVLVSVLDHNYAEKMFRSLRTAAPNASFEIWGMPTLSNEGSLKAVDAYPETVITYTAPFNFDAETSAGEALSQQYRTAYGQSPVDMSFRGYEVLQWCTYLLNKYGTVFNPKMGDNGAANFTRFDVKLRTDATGKPVYCENQNLYWVRYENGKRTIK